MDVAIATCRALPEPDADEPYYVPALERAGLSARLLAWDDPDAPFHEARLVVLRSTWNYIHDLAAFLAWVDRVGPRLHNPPAVVRWNVHKRYLVQLAEDGVATVPTVLLEHGQHATLADTLDARGWHDVVVKPAVSAGSFQTRRLTRAALSATDEAWLAELLATRDMLVQPFVASVDGYGERSLITLDGEVSHAIRKSPRFFDGAEAVSTTALPVADDERALAHAALTAGLRLIGHPGPLAYGRVDMARDAHGVPQVMELELVEPSLFFRQHPPAAEAWARALARRLPR